MKILLLFTLIFVFVFNSLASPLVFKLTKAIQVEKGKEYAEIGTFNTGQYNKIRIAVVPSGEGFSRLNQIYLHAVEDEKPIYLQHYTFIGNYSVFMDTPPSSLRISANESGIYKVYIWGS